MTLNKQAGSGMQNFEQLLFPLVTNIPLSTCSGTKITTLLVYVDDNFLAGDNLAEI